MKQNKWLARMAAAALALCLLTGCGAASSAAVSSAAASSVTSAVSAAASDAAAQGEITVSFTVTGADGTAEAFTLTAADGDLLADALLAAGLIGEEEAAAGFVTTVNGVTADYDADGAWWCLVDGAGEMTAVGIGEIALHDGDSYGFVYTVG